MLKSLNFSELEKIASELGLWSGAQVQDVTGSQQELGLRLHRNAEDLPLWLDLNAQAPLLLKLNQFPKHKKLKKPLHLFLKAHLIGMSLQRAEVFEDKGRVLFLDFAALGGVRTLRLELRLFPHARNCLALLVDEDGKEKKVSWAKADEVKAQDGGFVADQIRDWQEVSEAWLERRFSKSGKQVEVQSEEKRLKKDVKKKEKALEKLVVLLESRKSEKYRAAGVWLQSYGVSGFPSSIPDEYGSFLDVDESLAWNIENCFLLAKKEEAKKAGRLEQQEKLLAEIESLKKKLLSPEKSLRRESTKPKGLLEQAGAKGRQKLLPSGSLAVMGKSAKENLVILRRAKPWHYWLHLKDEPSAHVVITRNKGQDVSKKDLQEAFVWLAGQTFGKRVVDYQGQNFSVIVAECRHVKSIKGDKLGRVNYQNEKSFVFRL